MKNLPTLFYDKQELLLDLDIYGKIVSTPQTSREDLANLLFEEFKFTHPIPTFEDERYKLSNLVSTDYKIMYDNSLELSENESLVDLQTEGSEQPPDIFKIEVPKELQELFSYGKPVDESYKMSLMEKFELLDEENYSRGIASTEKLYGSVKEDRSTILTDDEIDELGDEQDEEYDISLDDEDDIDDEVSDDYLVDSETPDCEDIEDEEEYDLSSQDEDELVGEEEDFSFNDDEFDSSESNITTSEEKSGQTSEEVDEVDDTDDLDDDVEGFESDDDDYGSEEDDYSDDEDDDYSSKDEDLDEDDYDSEEDDYSDDEDEDYESDEEDYSEDEDEESYEDDDYGSEAEDLDDDYSSEDEPDDEEPVSTPINTIQSGITYEDDLDMDFVEPEPVNTKQSGAVSQKPRPSPLTENKMFGYEDNTPTPKEVNQSSPQSSEFGDDEPKELRAFLKKHPRCDMNIVLKYFSKKEVETQIRLGKVIKRGNTLRI